MKAHAMRRPRLQAAITGSGIGISATEARRRNIMAVARRVSSLERKAKRLRNELRQVVSDLRFSRKEFKFLTQEPEMVFTTHETDSKH